MVVLLGFEPRQAEPKTAVLPLHHKTILRAQAFRPKAVQSYALYLLWQNLYLKFFGLVTLR